MSHEAYEYEVIIRTNIYPTEKEKVVRYCLEEIFPVTEWEYDDNTLVGTTSSLERFAEVLDDMKIRDTARDHLLRKVRNGRCHFLISKQATCNRKVNLSIIEQPLGPVEVTIICERIESLIKEITKKRSKR